MLSTQPAGRLLAKGGERSLKESGICCAAERHVKDDCAILQGGRLETRRLDLLVI